MHTESNMAELMQGAVRIKHDIKVAGGCNGLQAGSIVHLWREISIGWQWMVRDTHYI